LGLDPNQVARALDAGTRDAGARDGGNPGLSVERPS
jgi:hypothetical protein